MVYRLLKKIIFISVFFLLPLNLNSNIIYDKDDIIISDIDLNLYKQLYFENFGENLNNPTAIKNIVILKNIIEHFKINNPNFLKKVDEVLVKEYGEEKMNIIILRDFIRYFKIKNEFINEYYVYSFNINDLNNIFKSFDKIELPISTDDCYTIEKLEDLKNNKSFLNNFFENLKKETRKYQALINDVKYNVCIDKRNIEILEKSILNYIDLITKEDFKKFVYDKQ